MDETPATHLDAPFVFMSYARDDSAWAEKLAAALERHGLKVWWDRHLRGGEAFGEEIERALDCAGAVLVVWSEAAKHSRWVLDEAASAADRSVLVPIALAGALPPLGFRQSHTIAFGGGAPERDPALKSLVDALSAKLGSAASPVPRTAVRRHKQWVPWATGAALIAMVGAGIAFAPGGRPTREPPASSAAQPQPAAKSVAVMPFRALSAGPEDGYFADGVTEEVINALGTVPELRVTGRTSTFSFKGQDVPVTQVARTLGVANVIEGSVRRSGDRLRVSARLVRASDGFQLWQASYDRGARDPFDVQSDIAANVAQALQVVTDDRSRRAMAMRRIANVEAFVAFQKGFELYERAHANLPLYATLKRANVEFDRAIKLAPRTSDAYLLRADLPTHLLWDAAGRAQLPAEVTPVDITALRRQLNSDLDYAYEMSHTPGRRLQLDFVRSFVSGDWAGLGRKLDATLASRECVEPIWLEEMNPLGRARQIGPYYERQAHCDPLALTLRRGAPWAWLWSGRPGPAVAAAKRLRATASDDRVSARIELWGNLLIGRHDQARQLLASDPVWRGTQGRVEALRLNRLIGDVQAAEAIHRELDPKPGQLERKLLMAAWAGDRATAAEVARQIDMAPMGHLTLSGAILRCLCGAPFPLEATPRFRAQLSAAGLAWPPPTLLRFPAKAW